MPVSYRRGGQPSRMPRSSPWGVTADPCLLPSAITEIRAQYRSSARLSQPKWQAHDSGHTRTPYRCNCRYLCSQSHSRSLCAHRLSESALYCHLRAVAVALTRSPSLLRTASAICPLLIVCCSFRGITVISAVISTSYVHSCSPSALLARLNTIVEHCIMGRLSPGETQRNASLQHRAGSQTTRDWQRTSPSGRETDDYSWRNSRGPRESSFAWPTGPL